MPTYNEMRREQKRQLYVLKKLRRDNKDKVIGLDESINMVEAEMEAEDVVWVEKKLAQLDPAD